MAPLQRTGRAAATSPRPGNVTGLDGDSPADGTASRRYCGSTPARRMDAAYAARIGDLDDRTYLVTGANSGIGREAARELTRRGPPVDLASRSEQKTRPVIEAIVADTGNQRVEFLPLDLGDLKSVRACAKEFLRSGQPLHCLINNAGLA